MTKFEIYEAIDNMKECLDYAIGQDEIDLIWEHINGYKEMLKSL